MHDSLINSRGAVGLQIAPRPLMRDCSGSERVASEMNVHASDRGAGDTAMMESLREGFAHNQSKTFGDSALARQYEEWYTGPGRRADRLEKKLLADLLKDLPIR